MDEKLNILINEIKKNTINKNIFYGFIKSLIFGLNLYKNSTNTSKRILVNYVFNRKKYE